MPEDTDEVKENSGVAADPVNAEVNGTLNVAAVAFRESLLDPRTEKVSDVDRYIPVDGSDVNAYEGIALEPSPVSNWLDSYRISELDTILPVVDTNVVSWLSIEDPGPVTSDPPAVVRGTVVPVESRKFNVSASTYRMPPDPRFGTPAGFTAASARNTTPSPPP
jgi:hypothetical protein